MFQKVCMADDLQTCRRKVTLNLTSFQQNSVSRGTSAQQPRFLLFLDSVPISLETPINPDAYVAITEHRIALARCRAMQGRTVDFYLDLKRRIEG